MNISINNYGIDLTCFSDLTEEIILGTGFIKLEKKLTSKEFNTFLSDTLTHEFIHGLLQREFNTTTCKLFDAIEQYFNVDYKLKEKAFSLLDLKTVTWNTFISKNGFNAFRADYHITKHMINQAYIITGGK